MTSLWKSVEVVIEVPRGSFKKRGASGTVDFISPFPCPFNYGSIRTHVSDDNDFLDAVVLGPRFSRGKRLETMVRGAVGFLDRDIYDDKIICSHRPMSQWTRFYVLLFFHFYAFCKRLLNVRRGFSGRKTACLGWRDPYQAFSRARLADGVRGNEPAIPF